MDKAHAHGYDSQEWDQVWADKGYMIEPEHVRKTIAEYKQSVEWRNIFRAVGAPTGEPCIELGAGLATFSLALAQEGAYVMLLDFSSKALEMAKTRAAILGVEIETRQADVFELPPWVENKYTLASSFGLAEHFKGVSRQKVFGAHYRSIMPEGYAIISVPNAICIPYRIFKFAAQRMGTWVLDDELPFSPTELRRKMTEAGFVNVRIFGTSARSAYRDYNLLLRNHMVMWAERSRFGRFLLRLKRGVVGRATYSDSGNEPGIEKESIFDNLLGANLIAIGQRPKT